MNELCFGARAGKRCAFEDGRRSLRGRSSLKHTLAIRLTEIKHPPKGEKMKKLFSVLIALFMTLGVRARGQETGPLKLIQTIKLPPDVKGHFDHFEVDLKGKRLFATPEAYKAVLVFDLETGKMIRTIGVSKSRTPSCIAKTSTAST